jgi:hypothetical protein
MTPEQIAERIDERLRAAESEIVALTAARTVLETRAARPRQREVASGTTRTGQAPRRRARRRRADKQVVPAGKLEQLLGASDGLTTAALAQETNADPGQMLPLLRELEAAGKIRRTGERRGVRWHAVTDEDRIAARAAELAGRSRAALRSS